MKHNRTTFPIYIGIKATNPLNRSGDERNSVLLVGYLFEFNSLQVLIVLQRLFPKTSKSDDNGVTTIVIRRLSQKDRQNPLGTNTKRAQQSILAVSKRWLIFSTGFMKSDSSLLVGLGKDKFAFSLPLITSGHSLSVPSVYWRWWWYTRRTPKSCNSSTLPPWCHVSIIPLTCIVSNLIVRMCTWNKILIVLHLLRISTGNPEHMFRFRWCTSCFCC